MSHFPFSLYLTRTFFLFQPPKGGAAAGASGDALEAISPSVDGSRHSMGNSVHSAVSMDSSVGGYLREGVRRALDLRI